MFRCGLAPFGLTRFAVLLALRCARSPLRPCTALEILRRPSFLNASPAPPCFGAAAPSIRPRTILLRCIALALAVPAPWKETSFGLLTCFSPFYWPPMGPCGAGYDSYVVGIRIGILIAAHASIKFASIVCCSTSVETTLAISISYSRISP